MLIYVDTNIFLNFLLPDRRNKFGKPLLPEAERFFQKVYATKDLKILISNKTLEELYGQIEPGQATMLFTFLKGKISIVKYTPEDLTEAEKLDPENRNDALHALLARKHGADCVVTRNRRHFKKFSFIKSKYPLEI